MIGYPSRKGGTILPAWDYIPTVSCKNITKFFSSIINPLLTKLVQSRWLLVPFVLVFFFFFFFANLCVYVLILVHKHAKKQLGQYPVILNSCFDNNWGIIISSAHCQHTFVVGLMLSSIAQIPVTLHLTVVDF